MPLLPPVTRAMVVLVAILTGWGNFEWSQMGVVRMSYEKGFAV